MMNHIVVVGTIANSATEEPDAAGCWVWGPFTREDADAFKQKVDAIFREVPLDDQIYGTTYSEVQQIRAWEGLSLDKAAEVAAANWYRRED